MCSCSYQVEPLKPPVTIPTIPAPDPPLNVPSTPDYPATPTVSSQPHSPHPWTATVTTETSTVLQPFSSQVVAGIQPKCCLNEMKFGVNVLYSTSTKPGI